MKIKQNILICFGIALILMTAGTATSAEIAVHPGESIQAAIDAASEGDTILVYPGEYTENVNVDKQLNIISTDGASVTSVIAASTNDHVFEVTADGVAISGFSVSGATTAYKAGIYLDECRENTISSNNISNNYEGIHLKYCNNSELSKNIFSSNILAGINLVYSNNNILSNNIAILNSYYGVRLYDSNSNTLINNNASINSERGIRFMHSSNNMVINNSLLYNDFCGISIREDSNNNIFSNNNASNNKYGIILSSSNKNNTLFNNTANLNSLDGITLVSSSNNNTLFNNTASKNVHKGISLSYSSSNNTLISNKASNNNYGITLGSSSNYNNLVSNTASGNTYEGIFLSYSSYNNVLSNTASDNYRGVQMYNSINNTLADNSISGNAYYGIYIYKNNNHNLIYNNYFNNTNNVYEYGINIGNSWNITKTEGPNVIDGPYIGGNYWAHPDGTTGFSQRNVDTDGDGFCDSPENRYYFDSNIDYLPLTSPSNQPPVADANGPYVGYEGSSITFVASSSSDPDGDTLTYRWDFDNDGTWDTEWSNNPIAANTWNDDWSGLVKLEVNDSKLTATNTTSVTVNNVAPTITSLTVQPTEPIEVGTEVDLTATFTDSDSDTHTWEINWGDETTSGDTSGLAVNAKHTYTTAGVYTVNLTITDDDGASDTEEYQYVVAYDPDGGFVTGGGYIDSPEGAYTLNPNLIGHADFGFVSKYKNGATVPTGTTEFEFKVADLNFHSDDYQWLVIAGSKAQYKGTGTINCEGDYEFMLTAIDGELKGDGIDKFRIKIWDKSTDLVIYDNNVGEDDLAEPTTLLQGGSIKIHKAK